MLATKASLADLVALFAGDDLLPGYPTDKLAEAICWEAQPTTIAELRRTIYGAQPQDAITQHAYRTMHRGFRAWTKAGRQH